MSADVALSVGLLSIRTHLRLSLKVTIPGGRLRVHRLPPVRRLHIAVTVSFGCTARAGNRRCCQRVPP